jgi:hypothetical protein
MRSKSAKRMVGKWINVPKRQDFRFWPEADDLGVAASRRLSGVQRTSNQCRRHGSPSSFPDLKSRWDRRRRLVDLCGFSAANDGAPGDRILSGSSRRLLKRAIDAETVPLGRSRNQNARLLKERTAARQPVVLLASNSDLIPSHPDDVVLS